MHLAVRNHSFFFFSHWEVRVRHENCYRTARCDVGGNTDKSQTNDFHFSFSLSLTQRVTWSMRCLFWHLHNAIQCQSIFWVCVCVRARCYFIITRFITSHAQWHTDWLAPDWVGVNEIFIKHFCISSIDCALRFFLPFFLRIIIRIKKILLIPFHHMRLILLHFLFFSTENGRQYITIPLLTR